MKRIIFNDSFFLVHQKIPPSLPDLIDENGNTKKAKFKARAIENHHSHVWLFRSISSTRIVVFNGQALPGLGRAFFGIHEKPVMIIMPEGSTLPRQGFNIVGIVQDKLFDSEPIQFQDQ